MHPRCSWILVFGVFALLGIAVSADGHDPFDPVDLGEEALDKNDWDTALARFSEAIRAQPKNARAYHGRGYVYGMKGNLDLAIAELTKAIELKDPTAYRCRASFYAAKGDYDHAIADCNETIRRDPNDAAVYSNRGIAYLYKGNAERAINDLNEAIRLDPKCADAYNNRGYAYYGQGRLDEAINDLTEAIRLDPKAAKPYGNRGLAWEAKGEYEKAIADLGGSLRRCPKDDTTYCLRGRVWAERGMFDRAIADLDAAIRLDPKNAEAFRIRAFAHYYKGAPEKAMADINEAIRLDPKASECYLTRAKISAGSGEIARVAADLAEAIRLAPNDPQAYLFRGAWLAQRHEFDKARADVDQAIKLNSKSPSAYEARGALWIARNDYERGMADIETAQRLNAAHPAAKFEPWVKHVPNPAAREHGERQLRQMLHDRPAMAQYGEKAAVLYQWAARKFAGEDLGRKIFWNAPDPMLPSDACNHSGSAEDPAYIQLRKNYTDGPDKGKPRSFDELWQNAVFELNNVTRADDFQQIDGDAQKGRLSKQEFVAKKADVESLAADKTLAFYIHVYLPWAKQHGVATSPFSWYLGQEREPGQRLRVQLTERDAYWRYTARVYDFIVMESLMRRRDDQKVVSLGAEMSKAALTPEERAEVHRAIGVEFLKVKKPWRAMDELNEALRLNPKAADNYVLRGYAYLMVRDPQHAMADCREALRLDPSSGHAVELRTAIRREEACLEKAKAVLAKFNCRPEEKKASAESDDVFQPFLGTWPGSKPK